ncbi:Hypothetical protein FKW44_016580, partial [Caligus rogercresseyi]
LSMKKHRSIVVEAWKKQSEEKERLEEENRRREEPESKWRKPHGSRGKGGGEAC